MRRFVFHGAPGVGKGTFAHILAPRLEVPLIGVGDLVRAAIHEGTPVGHQFRQHVLKGELVPDALVMDLVRQRLRQPDAQHGWLLDGYPRTLAQASHLDTVAQPDKVVNITLERRIAIQKMLGRRHCRHCKQNFNICSIHEGSYDMPAMPPDFDNCAHKDSCPRQIHGREDDTYQVMEARIKVHERETAPLVQYWQQRGLLVTFNVVKGVKDADDLMACMLA